MLSIEGPMTYCFPFPTTTGGKRRPRPTKEGEIPAETNMAATGEPMRVRNYLCKEEHLAGGAKPLWT